MLGKFVRVRVVAPMHTLNRRFGYEYGLNYGLIEGRGKMRPGAKGAYIMGVDHPVKNFDGRVIAVIRRYSGKGVVWVVAPKSTRFIINDIKQAVSFAEKKGTYDIECLFERSCGAVVLDETENEKKILLIKNKRSAHWGFPKGHIEEGESEKETAIRETKEETGIDIDIVDGFSCKSEYTIQGKVEKAVVIFLAKAKSNRVVKQDEEIDEYVWVDYNAALRMLKFENDRNILIKAKEYIDRNNI